LPAAPVAIPERVAIAVRQRGAVRVADADAVTERRAVASASLP